MSKSVEQRLFEAFTHDRPVLLSADEVGKLLCLDDAVLTRITNQAFAELGLDEPGVESVYQAVAAHGNKPVTWAMFKRFIRITCSRQGSFSEVPQ